MRFSKSANRRNGRNRAKQLNIRSNVEHFSFHSTNLSTESRGSRQVAKRLEPARLANFFKQLPGRLILAALVGIFIVFSRVDNRPIIVDRAASGTVNLLRDDKEYSNAIKKFINSSIFNSNKITFDINGFTASMKSQFPELDSAAINFKLFSNRPVVDLSTNRIAISLVTQQGSFLLNNDGVAIAKGTDIPGYAKLKIPKVTDESNLPINIGKGVLTSQEISFIGVLVAQLSHEKVIVDSISLPPIVNQLNIKLKQTNYIVKFDMKNDPRTAAGAFLAFKHRLDTDRIVPALYMDMRLEDRAYYN